MFQVLKFSHNDALCDDGFVEIRAQADGLIYTCTKCGAVTPQGNAPLLKEPVVQTEKISVYFVKSQVP